MDLMVGILLLAIIYYYNSSVLMVDKRVLEISPHTAIVLSLFSLIFSWFIYDFLCKSSLIKNNILFILTIFILLILISFGTPTIIVAPNMFLTFQ